MSRSKSKGTAWETAICRLLAAEGFPHVERRALAGTADRGDIAGIPGWVIEAKNCKKTELGAWVDEAAIEQANDGAEFSAVWHHRARKASPAEGYVTMTGATFVRLLHALGYGPLPVLNPDPHPDCPGEFHGADGGPCGECGWDAHPVAPPIASSASLEPESASPLPSPTREAWATTGGI